MPIGFDNQGDFLPWVGEKLRKCWLQVRLDPAAKQRYRGPRSSLFVDPACCCHTAAFLLDLTPRTSHEHSSRLWISGSDIAAGTLMSCRLWPVHSDTVALQLLSQPTKVTSTFI